MSAALSGRSKFALYAAPVALVVVVLSGGVYTFGQLTDPAATVPVGPADGSKLYATNCAYCHGERGEGNGPAAISPRARSFGFDKFRFAMTPNGVPTDDDLMRIVRNGIPGSAMPKFDRMTDDECRAVIGHVRQLARAGAFRKWLQKALKEDPTDPDLEGAAKKVEAEVAVLGPAALPALPPVQSLANGKKTFDVSCAQCHGPLGKGDGPQAQVDEHGTPIRPRDLTTGTYKGGGRSEDILARIYLGVPGTPMPATQQLAPQDLADLVGYVRSLALK
jgi:mono/diheme cytochrome c family protein